MSTSALTSSPSAELEARLQRWAQRLQDAGIEGLADALLSQGNPLPLLGAQVLWVLQPALGALMPLREVGELAQLLGSDSGLLWLRQQLQLDADDMDEAGDG
ncbi:MAG: hypothetical protein U0528_15580 [Anaerolineae bacterium]|nr:hypothetical protein [Anaerolineae bacterium]